MGEEGEAEIYIRVLTIADIKYKEKEYNAINLEIVAYIIEVNSNLNIFGAGD